MIILSVLICSLASRHAQLQELLNELHRQCSEIAGINGNVIDAGGYFVPVEVLTNVDNKEKSTGAKRNELLQAATGKYIIFIDDDDWIEPCYIKELLEASKSDADCFAMNGWITTNGGNRIDWRLSKNYENRTITENGHKQVYLRKTNHITATKRDLALQAGFPDYSHAEDKFFSDRVAPLCKSEFQILPDMYHYRYVTTNKEYL